MPDEQGSAAAFAIASHFARNGQWTLAREGYLLMVDRYPAHPRAADAYRWLIQYNSSSEARRRHEDGGPQAKGDQPPAPVQEHQVLAALLEEWGRGHEGRWNRGDSSAGRTPAPGLIFRHTHGTTIA